jgi:predicted ArsR family transcriptional regulator
MRKSPAGGGRRAAGDFAHVVGKSRWPNGDVSAAGLASAMSDLGYAARAAHTEDGSEEIQAFNCVYHYLAAQHPEVCAFDLALIEAATGKRPEHAECMVRGGGSCRFKFAKADNAG